MKNILTILFSIMVVSLSAQNFPSYGISTLAGAGFDKERGTTFLLDIEFKKHLGLGIYGLLSHGTGQAQKIVSNVGHPINGDQQLLQLGQFNYWGLGVAKSVQFSKEGKLNLSLIGQRIQQNRFILTDLVFDDLGRIEAEESTETYSTRNDLAFAVTLDYQYALTDLLSLGFFTRYQSTPNAFLVGLRATTSLNAKQNQQSLSESDQTPRHLLGLRIGYGGGDGFPKSTWVYDVEYGYKIGKKFTLMGKLFMAQGGSRLNDLTVNFDDFFENSNHIAVNNESENPVVQPISLHSAGLGIKTKANTMQKSSIGIYLGMRYFRQTFVSVQSSRFSSDGALEDLKAGYNYKNTISPEIGLHYDYQLNNNLYLGTSANLVVNNIFISGGVHVGTNF